MEKQLRLLSNVPKGKVNKSKNLLKRKWDRIVPQMEPNFLSKSECEKIMALSTSLDSHKATAGGVIRNERSTSVKWIEPDKNSDWLFSKLDRLCLSMNKIFQMDLLGFFEAIQIGVYGEGQFFDWHTDFDGYPLRKLTIAVQLSSGDEYEGGDLQFMDGPHIRTASREPGSAVIFPTHVLHKVTPITGGVRKSLVVWISGPPFK